jgi:uncharacterized protein YbgA (DUF1722 family)
VTFSGELRTEDVSVHTEKGLAKLRHAKVEDDRRGLVPLVVPLTLICRHVRVLDIRYLRDQVYLNPHPKELALRNYV